MSDLSVHSDAVWHLNNLFLLQFNMRLLTLQPLSEPHHSSPSLYPSQYTADFFSLSLYKIYVSVSFRIWKKNGTNLVSCVTLQSPLNVMGVLWFTSFRRIICCTHSCQYSHITMQLMPRSVRWTCKLQQHFQSHRCHNSLHTSFYFQQKNVPTHQRSFLHTYTYTQHDRFRNMT